MSSIQPHATREIRRFSQRFRTALPNPTDIASPWQARFRGPRERSEHGIHHHEATHERVPQSILQAPDLRPHLLHSADSVALRIQTVQSCTGWRKRLSSKRLRGCSQRHPRDSAFRIQARAGCRAGPIDGTEGNAIARYPIGLMRNRDARGHRWSSLAQEVFTLRSREAEHAGC